MPVVEEDPVLQRASTNASAKSSTVRRSTRVRNGVGEMRGVALEAPSAKTAWRGTPASRKEAKGPGAPLRAATPAAPTREAIARPKNKTDRVWPTAGGDGIE